MDLTGYELLRLNADYSIKPFDCGDKDLNEYLVNDAKIHLRKLLFITYLIEKDGKTAAFFCVANDVITYSDAEHKNKWRNIVNTMRPNDRGYKSYPAVKLGRLGVHLDFQRRKLGTSILDYLKELFITENRTGCMFVTVDAYLDSVSFYQKNGFKFLCFDRESRENRNTRLMFYDLRLLQ